MNDHVFLLTPAEVAAMLHVARSSLYELLASARCARLQTQPLRCLEAASGRSPEWTQPPICGRVDLPI
jgi:hypothetical protein